MINILNWNMTYNDVSFRYSVGWGMRSTSSALLFVYPREKATHIYKKLDSVDICKRTWLRLHGRNKKKTVKQQNERDEFITLSKVSLGLSYDDDDDHDNASENRLTDQ